MAALPSNGIPKVFPTKITSFGAPSPNVPKIWNAWNRLQGKINRPLVTPLLLRGQVPPYQRGGGCHDNALSEGLRPSRRGWGYHGNALDLREKRGPSSRGWVTMATPWGERGAGGCHGNPLKLDSAAAPLLVSYGAISLFLRPTSVPRDFSLSFQRKQVFHYWKPWNNFSQI